MSASASAGLDRLELRVERLQVVFRFTYAFHARELRFERDRGAGFERIFPETFSFHASRHDPAELYLQFDDLARKPELLAPRANARDCELLIARLMLELPRYLERLIGRLEREQRIEGARLTAVYEDMALLSRLVSRFLGEHSMADRPGIGTALLHLRKLSFRCLDALVRRRVSAERLAEYVGGRFDPFDASDDLSEAGFFHVLAGDDLGAIDRVLLRVAERAFFRWLEDVCLDEDNGVFELENSPFAKREDEVLAAVGIADGGRHVRPRQLSPYLRRPGNRDSIRVVNALARWFLRQYDVDRAAAMLHHASDLAQGVVAPDRVLSHHRTANYAGVLALLGAPYLGAAFAYPRAPIFFDALCAGQLVLLVGALLWFLLYRFCWKRDLTLFHTSAPRIAAGIIVGYLPIFFIDEVWGFAHQAWPVLVCVSALLGFLTLLYIYVEVQRRLVDVDLAFRRARQIFLLGVLQAFCSGLVISGLTGGMMASRNWSPAGAAPLPVGELRAILPPFVGELPMIVGSEPFLIYPAAVFSMTFLSFFIGTFLQLLWEDIPITEPL